MFTSVTFELVKFNEKTIIYEFIPKDNTNENPPSPSTPAEPPP